jgi:hypothetical protein
MTVDATDLADRILDCCRQMELCAREGRWGDLAEIEHERKGLIEAWMSSMRVASSPQPALQRLDAILESNRAVLRLSEERRDHLMRLLRDSRQQRRAARAYRERAGGL